MLIHHLSPHLRLVPTTLALLGLGSFLVLSGCGDGGGYAPVTDKAVEEAEAHPHEEHEHHHEAPHGGHLIELGDHLFNAEVVLDKDAGQLIVYVLDAHAENAQGVAQEQIEFAVEGGDAIALAADPQESDAEGHASRFTASGDQIAAIEDIEHLHGSVTVEINGESYTGELTHDHDHGHDH
ncbi:MAG: hypothetical protein KDA93_22530 [Planctomycetaceae bacterium]|nr:hypothetical protein [Planctomycetaceae bacterium]